MPTPNNPFQQNPYGKTNVSLLDPSKPVFSSAPTTATLSGGTSVTTQNPLVLDTPKFKLEKTQAQKDFEARMKLNERMKLDQATTNESKLNWWQKRTKTQKGFIIGGSILAVGVIVFFIAKAIKK